MTKSVLAYVKLQYQSILWQFCCHREVGLGPLLIGFVVRIRRQSAIPPCSVSISVLKRGPKCHRWRFKIKQRNSLLALWTWLCCSRVVSKKEILSEIVLVSSVLFPLCPIFTQIFNSHFLFLHLSFAAFVFKCRIFSLAQEGEGSFRLCVCLSLLCACLLYACDAPCFRLFPHHACLKSMEQIFTRG